jgi:mannose-6-phosphate isomerase-like protein (cupin superfamily)
VITNSPKFVPGGAGRSLRAGGFGTDFNLWSENSRGLLSVVEHPIDAGILGPPHVHSREDQTSYVIEGQVDMLVGEETFRRPPGSYVFKPRGIPHTFWNPGGLPARREAEPAGGFAWLTAACPEASRR